MMFLRAIPVVILGAVLTGCSLAPSYERPDVGADVAAYTAPTVEVSAATIESDIGAPQAWWRDFGSPELDALVDEAFAANPDLTAAAARVLETRAQFGGQRFNQLPSAEIGGTVARSKRNLAGFGIPRTILSTQWDVATQVAWEPDFWSRLSNTRKGAWAAFLASEANRHAVRQGLAADVVRTWLEVKQLEEQRDLGARTLATYRHNEAIVLERYAAGVRPSLDVHLARQNVSAADAAQAQRELDLANARRGLELLLGRYPAATVSIGTTSLADLPALPPIPVGLPSDLLERRPDVVAAEMNLIGAHAREGAARAELFPRLTISGSAGWSTPDEAQLFKDTTSVWSLVGNLAMPLLNRGARKAAVGAAEAQREQVRAAYVGTVLRAFRDVETALDTDHAQRERRDALQAGVRHAQRALEVAEDRYDQGLDPYLQVLDAQRRLLQTQSDLLRTEQGWRAARVNLIQALGGTWDESNDEQPADELVSAMQ